VLSEEKETSFDINPLRISSLRGKNRINKNFGEGIFYIKRELSKIL
jgi:hypothetical protein